MKREETWLLDGDEILQAAAYKAAFDMISAFTPIGYLLGIGIAVLSKTQVVLVIGLTVAAVAFLISLSYDLLLGYRGIQKGIVDLKRRGVIRLRNAHFLVLRQALYVFSVWFVAFRFGVGHTTFAAAIESALIGLTAAAFQLYRTRKTIRISKRN